MAEKAPNQRRKQKLNIGSTEAPKKDKPKQTYIKTYCDKNSKS